MTAANGSAAHCDLNDLSVISNSRRVDVRWC